MFRSLQFLTPLVVLVGLMGSDAYASQKLLEEPASRIVAPVEDTEVVTLGGNVHALARPEYDRGVVAAETRMERMVLVLKPSAAQQRALDALVEAQHDPESPLYHQWMTPEEFGARFGMSSRDLMAMTSWLVSHGFTVEPVSAGRSTLVFSGTAAQVSDAFHTEIHRYAVNGAMHVANSQDPQVPAAFAPVVKGILSMNSFRRTSAIRSRRLVAAPENTQGGTHYLFPADYATIYDLNALYAAGTNGAGVSIAIVGRSNINLSDVTSFRSTSGLSANNPTIILDGANPGLVSGDQDESTLDVEWSGATAPGATVKFVVAASTSASDGVDLSAQYIVNHKTATVMSTSYGSCEAYMGSGEMAFYNSLWQQAASEGITSFVSSGDSGAAGCNGGSSTSGSTAGVNGLCSSPYSTCVGGTEFNEGSGSYWATTNGAGGGSALGYIPEKVWNESGSAGGSGLWSSGGGISQYYTQPSWQLAAVGANSNGKRAVPDVALTAAGHDGYLINENGSWYVIAGTSAASPAFAGIMATVVQKQGGVGQGNANPTLYGLLNAATKPFHATLTGNNSVPGVSGFAASGTAYNLATGLGSVDAKLLVAAWPSTGGGTTTAGFTVMPSVATESLTPGKTATFTIAVAATGGFSDTVTLSAKTPSGVTLTLTPTSVKPGATVTATLNVTAAAAAGTSNITISGVSAGVTQTATVALTVQTKPTLTVTLNANKAMVVAGGTGTILVTSTTGGTFTGTVVLAASGLPTGVTATWAGGSYTPSVNGSTVSTLTLHAATTASLATTNFTITATGDGLTTSTSASVQVTAAPSITAALSPASISMQSMGTQALTVTVTPVGGVSLAASASTASFLVTGLPAGITGTWGAASVTTAGTLQARLTLMGSTSALATSTHPVIAVGVLDSTTAKAYSAKETLPLTVARVLPTVALALGTSKATVVQGQTGTFQVTTTVGGSFAGSVALGVTGLPAGVTATWTNGSFAATAAGSTTSTLTLHATAAAAVASSVFNITATGDGVTANTAASVQVTHAPGISIALSPASISMKSTATQVVTVTVAPLGSAVLGTNASYKIVGLPTGISASWSAASLTPAGTLLVQMSLVGSSNAISTSTQPTITVTVTDAATEKVYTESKQGTLTVTRAAQVHPVAGPQEMPPGTAGL